MQHDDISLARALFGREVPAETEQTEPIEQPSDEDQARTFAAKLFNKPE